MTMNNPLAMALSVVAGIGLGTIFFGGLWWTVHKAMTFPRPVHLFFGSLILRMSIALFGFYWIGKDDWKLLIACFIGFIIARLAVTWVTRQLGEIRKESSHAP
jgi:F1F0 ATPase subunit 2